MLDDFSIEQTIAYKTLINSVKNNKCSHAFLLETNGYYKALDLAIAFAKYLLCPNNYSNKEKCKDCNQCNTIDKREFIELKIIEPDGQWIKKSQLDELQSEFSKKSIIGTKKVYIINDAHKLNVSSSNSLLKFLEEPEDGIIAILITENAYQLLNTIVSRCQILSLRPNNIKKEDPLLKKIANELFNDNKKIEEYIIDEHNMENVFHIIDFIKYYEENKELTLLYINKYWNNYFKERDSIYIAFSIMLLFYKDVLNYMLNNDILIFNDQIENLKYVSDKNTIDNIIHKINVIMDLREKIKFNINSNALMDKLIINLEGRK